MMHGAAAGRAPCAGTWRRPWLPFADRFVLSAGHTVPLGLPPRSPVLNERSASATSAIIATSGFAFPDDGKWALTWEQLLRLRRRGGTPGLPRWRARPLLPEVQHRPSGHGMPPAVGEALGAGRACQARKRSSVFVFEVRGADSRLARRTRGAPHGLGPSAFQPRRHDRLERLRHRRAPTVGRCLRHARRPGSRRMAGA
jgi:hypothetical protein